MLGQDIWCRFNGGLADTLWYYRAVTDALQQVSVPKRIVEELLRVVMELEALVATGQKP